MSYLSTAFNTMNTPTINLAPKETRINPRPDSSKEQNKYFKEPSNYLMIQKSSKLGALRPNNMNNVNNKQLQYIKPINNKEILTYKTNTIEIRKPFKGFDDWLILGIIIISVGLFMRLKDKV
jgi:hypothetical protein